MSVIARDGAPKCRSCISVGSRRNLRVLRWVRDRAGGTFCSAHVLRRRPAAAFSPFTSLRRTSHRPDLDTPSWFSAPKPVHVQPREAGGRCSEVKGEWLGAAQPGGHELRRPPASLGARCPQVHFAFYANRCCLFMRLPWGTRSIARPQPPGRLSCASSRKVPP